MENLNLDCVFIGTTLNANYLKDILKENGIQCMVRDFLVESSMAGFAAASTYNAAKVFVDEKDDERAEEIVFNLFEEEN
ncbi:MAG: DUF2007 domain-containing protein [Bacteroidales bacterium]|jgi:hypothetical protein|nr:DUF2007 domain-containing protein [Bacteroidales bacterium]